MNRSKHSPMWAPGCSGDGIGQATQGIEIERVLEIDPDTGALQSDMLAVYYLLGVTHSMYRALVPHTSSDRFSAAGAIVFSITGIAQAASGQPRWQAALSLVAVVLSVLNAYIFQDQPKKDVSGARYTKVIGRIGKVTENMQELQAFLEEERTRVEEAESTLADLNAERTRLEPVVTASRETVEAILQAHSDRTLRTVWKERIVGFTLGVVASVIASFIYEYMRAK